MRSTVFSLERTVDEIAKGFGSSGSDSLSELSRSVMTIPAGITLEYCFYVLCMREYENAYDLFRVHRMTSSASALREPGSQTQPVLLVLQLWQ